MPNSKSATHRTASAQPTKAFFVRMLTRDISLEDCILDLVDNSVDGAWRQSKKTPDRLVSNKDLSEFKIDVRFSPTSFSVLDNCGGISLDDAVNYAFTFGRRESQKSSPFSVGVYGIGMKRAVFKIGNDISVESTYSEKGKTLSYVVPINVDQWLRSDESSWDFNIDDSPPLRSPGVKISVKDLTEETSNRLTDPTYETHLRRILGRDYLVPLMRGLTIAINGRAVEYEPLVLQQSKEFVPMNDNYDDSGVNVDIRAGMWRVPPNSSEPREGRPADTTSGWYVICNGRVILDADRTELTGWGEDRSPAWHPQYSGFLGLISFTSKDPLLLPMTTTKRSVDVSSAVYLRAIPRIQQTTKVWTSYTSQRKGDPDVANSAEEKTTSRDISNLTKSSLLRLPTLTLKSRSNLTSVQYQVETVRMRRLAGAFGNRNLSNREVGKKAFDFAFENLTEPEDE
jgi:hypothetical protein